MDEETVPGIARTTRPTESERWRQLRHAVRENGQALVEFAIVVPLILLLVLGIADFGLAYNFKNDQTSLANQALRYAVVNQCAPCGPGQSVEEFVTDTADSGELRDGNSPGSFGIQQQADVNGNPVGVKVFFCLPPGSSGHEGEPIEAVATSQYNWLPFLKIGTDVTITSTATGRIEPDASYQPGSSVYAKTYTLGSIPCPT